MKKVVSLFLWCNIEAHAFISFCLNSEMVIEDYVNEAVKNVLEKVPECSTNDTQLVQCMQDTVTEKKCYPVLVKCGSMPTTSASNSVLGPTLTVVLIVIVGSSIAVVLLIIFFVLKKRKFKQKQENKDSR